MSQTSCPRSHEPDRVKPIPGTSKLRVFVGDIQGCADELEDLLAAIPFDSDRHELWFAGDIVNRGPDSLAALRRVVALGAGAVIGNHDLHLLAIAEGVRRLRAGDTLEELLAAGDKPELLKWLRARPLRVTWSDIVLVHAGLHPSWKPPQPERRQARDEAPPLPIETRVAWLGDPYTNPEVRFATTVRHCDAYGKQPERGDSPSSPGSKLPGRFRRWDELYGGDHTVVFGHWAARGLVKASRLRGLDTGCVWGGELTAWIAEEDRFVSVPARRAYASPDG